MSSIVMTFFVTMVAIKVYFLPCNNAWQDGGIIFGMLRQLGCFMMWWGRKRGSTVEHLTHDGVNLPCPSLVCGIRRFCQIFGMVVTLILLVVYKISVLDIFDQHSYAIYLKLPAWHLLILTYLLTYSMEQSTFLEANRFSASKEITRILCTYFLTYLLSFLLTYLFTYLLTFLLTYSMEQSISWEANRFSASQEITRILCTYFLTYFLT